MGYQVLQPRVNFDSVIKIIIFYNNKLQQAIRVPAVRRPDRKKVLNYLRGKDAKVPQEIDWKVN